MKTGVDGVPGGVQTMKTKEAFESFRDRYFEVEGKLWNLDNFRKEVAKASSLDPKDVDCPKLEVAFESKYRDDYFDGDTGLLTRVIRFAYDEQIISIVSWLSIKDSVSPALANNKMFDGLLSRAQGDIGYSKYFGGLGSLTTDKDRTIFSPSAYFVDLLRMMYLNFDPLFMKELKSNRRPDLFNLALSPDNTRDTLPLIDIINENLEMLLLSEWNKKTPEEEKSEKPFSIDRLLAESKFPFNLPHHKGLVAIRANLNLEKGPDMTYAELIYQVNEDFGTGDRSKSKDEKMQFLKDGDRRVEELLDLSPEEAEYVQNSSISIEEIASFYGYDTKGSDESDDKIGMVDAIKDLSNVQTFLSRTGLNREELKLMIEGELTADQLAAGESRNFFINDVQDSKPPLLMKTNTVLENVVVELGVTVTVKAGEKVPSREDIVDDLDFKQTSDEAIIERYVLLKLSLDGSVKKDITAKIGYSKSRNAEGEVGIMAQEKAVTAATLKGYIIDQIFSQFSIEKLEFKLGNNYLSDNKTVSAIADEWLQGTHGSISGQNDYVELDDAILNLSWGKLDRIHRFIRLWRKANMSFKQLDWLIAPRQQVPSRDRKEGSSDSIMAYCPYFDGINDVISIELPLDGQIGFVPSTIEFWVKPMRSGRTKIMQVVVKDEVHIAWALGLDEEGKLVFVWKDKEYVCGSDALPFKKFSHVAVRIEENAEEKTIITGFMNGREDFTREISVEHVINTQDKTQKIVIGESFKGCFQELRVWDTGRKGETIRSEMNSRIIEQEHLVHYWPLNTSYGGEVWDAIGGLESNGNLGDRIHAQCPRFIVSDVPLDAQNVPGMLFSDNVQLLAGEGLPIHGQTGKKFFIDIILTVMGVNTDEGATIFLDEKGDGKSSVKLYLKEKKTDIEGVVEAYFEVNGEPMMDSEKQPLMLKVERMYNLRFEWGGTSEGATWKNLSEISSTSFMRDSTSDSLDKNKAKEKASTVNDRSDTSTSVVKIGEGFNGVIHRLKVGSPYTVDSKIVFIADVADWTMINTAPEGVIVEDSSGNKRTVKGGKLLRDQLIDFKRYEGRGASVAFGMDGKSVVEITNKNNVGFARFPPVTLGVWFSLGHSSTSKEVIIAQGDDDVGLLCYVLGNELKVTLWTSQKEKSDHQSREIASFNLTSETKWHHLGVALEPPKSPEASWKIEVTVDETHIIVAEDKLKKLSLSPTESIYLGGIRDLEGRQIVVLDNYDDGAETSRISGDDATGAVAIGRQELCRFNFRGKLADFRIWDGFLAHHQIREAKFVSSIYQRGQNGINVLLVIPLDRESANLCEMKRDEETIDTGDIDADGVPLALREDRASWEKSGISEFKAVLFMRKTVLNTSSAASTFAFSKQVINLPKDYKVTGRFRLTNSEGRVAILVGGLALTWDGKNACFRITNSDNLGGGFDNRGVVFSPDKENLNVAMRVKCPKWFQFAIQVKTKHRNDPSSGSSVHSNVWYQGGAEPSLKCIDFELHLPSEEQLRMGTVGVWTYGKGTKQIDDLAIIDESTTAGHDGTQMKNMLLLDEGFEKGLQVFDANWDVKQCFINSENVVDIRSNDENIFLENIPSDPSTIRLFQPVGNMWPSTMRKNSCYTVTGSVWIPENIQKVMGVAFYISQSPVLVGTADGDDRQSYLSFYTFGWSNSKRRFELVRNSSTLGLNRSTLAISETNEEVSGWHKFEVIVTEGFKRSTHIEASIWKVDTKSSLSETKVFRLSTDDNGIDRLTCGGVGFYSTDERTRFFDVNVFNDRNINIWKGTLGRKFDDCFVLGGLHNGIESVSDDLMFGFNEGDCGDAMRLDGKFLITNDAGSIGFLLKVGCQSKYIGVEIGTTAGKGLREITKLTKTRSKVWFEHKEINQKIEIEAGQLYNFSTEVIPSNFVTCLSHTGILTTQFGTNMRWPIFWESGKVNESHCRFKNFGREKISRLIIDGRADSPRLVILQGTLDDFGDEVWSDDMKMPFPKLPFGLGRVVLLTSSDGRKIGVGETVVSIADSVADSEESVKFLLRQTNSGKLILKVENSQDILWESSGHCFDGNYAKKCCATDVSMLRVNVRSSSENGIGRMDEMYHFLFRHNRSETSKIGVLSNGAAGNEFRDLRCRDVFRLLDHGDKGAMSWRRSDIELSSKKSTTVTLVHTNDDWEQALVSVNSPGGIKNDEGLGFDIVKEKYIVAKPYALQESNKISGWTWQARISVGAPADEGISLLTFSGLNCKKTNVELHVTKNSIGGKDTIELSFKGLDDPPPPFEIEGSLRNALVTVKSHLNLDDMKEKVSVFLNGYDICLQCKVDMSSTLYISRQVTEKRLDGIMTHMILFRYPLPETDIREMKNLTMNEILSKSKNPKTLLSGGFFKNGKEVYQLWPTTTRIPLLDVNYFSIGGREKRFHPLPVIERLPESLTHPSLLWKRNTPVITFPQQSPVSINSNFDPEANRRRTIEVWFMANDVNRPGKQVVMTGEEEELRIVGGKIRPFEVVVESGYIYFGPDIRSRIFSGHSYCVAIVLNSSREERLGSYAAYLNGNLVGTARGKMSSPPTQIYLGGDSFDGKVIALSTSNCAKTGSSIVTIDAHLNLLFENGVEKAQDTQWLGRDIVSTPSPQVASKGGIDSVTLQKVAVVRWLNDRDKIKASEGVFFFGPLSSDEVERVYAVGGGESWDPLEISIPWLPSENSIESYSVRLLIAASLKVSSQDLDDLLIALGIDLNNWLTVDGAFLFRLLRFSRFVKLLGISGKGLTAILIELTGTPELPESPGDLIYLTRTLDWLLEARGVPAQSLPEFLDEPVPDSSVFGLARFVTNRSQLASFTLTKISFVNGELIDEEASRLIFTKIKTSSFVDNQVETQAFLSDDDEDDAGTVVSRLRTFNLQDLREDDKWRMIFRPHTFNGVLDDLAGNDLAKELTENESLNSIKSTVTAENAIKSLKESGFLFGPGMSSKKIFDLESFVSEEEDVWNILNQDPVQRQIWNKLLPRWVRKWAGVKEQIEVILLDHRRALDDVLSAGFAEVFNEDIKIARTINFDIKKDPIVADLKKILSKEKSPTEMKARIRRLRKEADTLSSINALADIVLAQMETFTLTADSFVSTDISEEMSLAVFSALYPNEDYFVGMFLDGRTRTVVPRLRGVTVEAIRTDNDWKHMFRPEDERVGLLDEFARADLVEELKSSRVPEGARDSLVEEVMQHLVEDETGILLFGPSVSSTQFFDVAPIREEVDESSVYKQFWNVLLPKFLRKWAKVKEQIEIVFTEFRTGLDDVFTAAIAQVFELDDDSAAAINLDVDFQNPLVRELKSVALEKKEASTELKNKIAKIDNAANLSNAVGLELSEVTLLWKMPEVFEVNDLSRITFDDLIILAKYTEIRDLLLEIEDEDGIQSDTNPLEKLLGWLTNLKESRMRALNGIRLDENDARKLTEGENNLRFGISQFWRASRLVKVMRKTGTVLELVLELGQLEKFKSNDFERWNLLASSLAESVSFVTSNVKEKLFEATQVQLRDALLGVVSNAYRNQLENVTVVDSSLAISNFLLFDVLTGPKVLVSRIQQAIASIQFLINRCLMGLENYTDIVTSVGEVTNIQPFQENGQDDVLDHWERWMKNYRVWEATRKVFLYPENFLDPDLRKNKTPLFEDFTSKAGDGTDPSNAITEYLQNFQALSTVRIVGSTFSTPSDPDDEDDNTQKLALVGIRDGETFVRERIQIGTATLWRPWEKASISASSKGMVTFISPVYAFGRLHLFWIKEDKKVEQMYNAKISTKSTTNDDGSISSTIDDDDGSISLTIDVAIKPPTINSVITESAKNIFTASKSKAWTNFKNKLENGFNISFDLYPEIFDPTNPLAPLPAFKNRDVWFLPVETFDSLLRNENDFQTLKTSITKKDSIISKEVEEEFKKRYKLFKKNTRDLLDRARDNLIEILAEEEDEILKQIIEFAPFYGFYYRARFYEKLRAGLFAWLNGIETWISNKMDGIFRTQFDAEWKKAIGSELDKLRMKFKSEKYRSEDVISVEVIRMNIQYQSQSSDKSWSLVKDVQTSEAMFVYKNGRLPGSSEQFSADHLRPQEKVIRLISGNIPVGKNLNTEAKNESNGFPFVFDVTSSESNGLQLSPLANISSSSILWETLILIQMKDRVLDNNTEYYPQRVSLYDLKIEDLVLNVSLEQIIHQSNDLLNDPKSANAIFKFLKDQGDDPNTNVDTFINILGLKMLKNNGFLPESIKRTLDLGADLKPEESYEDFLKRTEETNDQFFLRMRIILPEMEEGGESSQELEKRRSNLVKAIQTTAIEAISNDDWSTVSSFIEDPGMWWLKVGAKDEAKYKKLFEQQDSDIDELNEYIGQSVLLTDEFLPDVFKEALKFVGQLDTESDAAFEDRLGLSQRKENEIDQDFEDRRKKEIDEIQLQAMKSITEDDWEALSEFINNPNNWLIENPSQGTKDIKMFVESRLKNEALKTSVDDIISYLGPNVLFTDLFLPNSIKKALMLGKQNENESNSAFSRRMRIVLPEMADDETPQQFQERRLKIVNAIQSTAINAISFEDWASAYESILMSHRYNLIPDKVNAVVSIQNGPDFVIPFSGELETSVEAQQWRPLQMLLSRTNLGGTEVRLDLGSVSNTFLLDYDFLGTSKGIIPTIGSNSQRPSPFIEPTIELFMSESRIWQLGDPNSFQDGLVAPPYKRYKSLDQHIGKNSLVQDASLKNNEQANLQFSKAPKELKFEVTSSQIPNLTGERIFIWKDKTVYDIDIAGEVRRRDLESLEIESNGVEAPENQLLEKFLAVKPDKYSAMYLLPVDHKKNINFGKIAFKKKTLKMPMGLSREFFSSRSNYLDLSTDPDDFNVTNDGVFDAVIASVKSGAENEMLLEEIDMSKSFLMPIGNMKEGWVLDTSDERFLILPSVPRTIMDNRATDNSSDSKFEIIRLGSKTAFNICFKEKNGINSLYLPTTQTDVRESKTLLRWQKEDVSVPISLPDVDSAIDFSGPNGVYYREIFFEIPLHLATTLNSVGDYQSAQKWMNYIFNPQKKEKIWSYRPFRELLENPPIPSKITDPTAIAILQRNLFDPHAIADTRIVAHMKAFMFRYIDNLLDWGDSLFAQDTREAINESLILYFRCLAILGERPYSIPGDSAFESAITSVGEILQNEDSFTKSLFLPGWKNRPVVRKYSDSDGYFLHEVSLENPAVLGQFFQVPENKQLLTYWDRLDDRLDKIRRSLNISGIFRQLPLFQPPIDPRALIAAGGASGALVSLPVPNYRYSFLLDTAKEMVETTMAFGAQFQAALETGSAEELAMQELKMSIAVNTINQRIKSNEMAAAEEERQKLIVTQEVVRNKLNRVLAKLEGGEFKIDENTLIDVLDSNAVLNFDKLKGERPEYFLRVHKRIVSIVYKN